MLLPPKDLNQQTLLRVIEEQFGIAGHRPEFSPLGEDSWCFRMGPLWVSLRRDLRGHRPAAYEAAVLLRQSGLDFVLAPLPGTDGRIVRQIDGFPVVVFPYLPTTPLATSPPSSREVSSVVEMLTRLHNSSVAVDLPRETYALSFDADLDLLLSASDNRPAGTGPYSERLHRLLRTHRKHIMAMRSEYTKLALICSAEAQEPVLTHGEPIPSNILRHADHLLLADWGDALWGQPERDWCHVIRTLGTAPACRAGFRRLYDLWWVLSEIAEYSTIFLNEHSGHSDDEGMWDRLVRYLPETV